MKLALPLSIVLSLLAPMAQAQTPALQVTFTRTSQTDANDTVTVDGATAGGKVVLIGVQRYADGLTSILVPVPAVLTADASGHASLVIAPSIAWRSDWGAVDFGSGRYVLAQPDGFRTAVAPTPTLHSAAGQVTDIYTGSGSVDVLYVEPARGAWFAHSDDGTQTDVDTASSGVGIRLGTMQPLITPGTQPVALATNGIIILIDDYTMQMIGVHVADLGAAQ